jgi:hypothetical protein
MSLGNTWLATEKYIRLCIGTVLEFWDNIIKYDTVQFKYDNILFNFIVNGKKIKTT